MAEDTSSANALCRSCQGLSRVYARPLPLRAASSASGTAFRNPLAPRVRAVSLKSETALVAAREATRAVSERENRVFPAKRRLRMGDFS